MPLPGELSRRPAPPPELKEAVRRLLGLDEDTSVVIRQLACTEPGCPPLETVIAVLPMDGPGRRWTLHRPAAQVTEDDLRTLFTTVPEGA
ncbi:hypothetical protein MUU72_34050 [Streptomyces sp. RS10V-4]|uniref:hypothetical protein n=1 Tax=Streptomyces rhizoryzae TaxID=2932493 RepID=UPI002002F817|nr:hypothetical protein [Streptomyces rhizoryzae]MCK7628055.1 hypothetical protein [Streptomyces rhizoryzae]